MHRPGHGFHSITCVDDANTMRLGDSELEVALADALVEVEGFVVETGFGGRAGLIAGRGALLAERRGEVEQNGEVRAEALATDAIEIADDADAQAANDTLIDDGGIGKAVGDDNASGAESGEDDLLHGLGATGEVEQQLGNGKQMAVSGIEQNGTNLVADGGAARFAMDDGGMPRAVSSRTRRSI
jgi:hypothetical protein